MTASHKYPEVTIIMPVYNYGRFVGRAIRSVQAQTYKEWELIIVDDGSTDETPEILRKYKGEAKIIRQEHKNAAAARNRAIAVSEGEFIAYLDADDEYLPRRTEIMVEYLQKHPELGGVGSGHYEVLEREDGSVKRYPVISKRHCRYNYGFPFLYGTVMHRRDCLDEVGGFDENLDIYEFLDFLVRFSRKYTLGYIRRALYRHYVHGNNSTLVRDRAYWSERVRVKWAVQSGIKSVLQGEGVSAKSLLLSLCD